ncbi:MAG: TonB-dependent receptor [Gammaproteobacteria bacterium]|nr:TonB-dependent receptor [Gammaproteobacteria bacterium]
MIVLSRIQTLCVAVVFTACVDIALAAAPFRVPLADALVQLQDQGHRIVFSTDLVAADLVVEVAAVTLPNVRRALPGVGLKLEEADGYWLVTRAVAVEPSLEPPDRGSIADDLVETIIVTGTRHRVPQRSVSGSATTMLAEELSVVPVLAGDAMRITNRLPGVSSVGVSARPRVRGGLQDELLIMVDGVELLEAFHLADFQSVFSTIDDRTVDAIDVYTGGFPARYGNRMSGVMEVSTLKQADKPGTEIGISVFSLFANRRGSIGKDTDYLVSARRGNLDLVTKQVNSKVGTPRYHDAYARLSHRISDDARLFGGIFYTRDDVSLKEDADDADGGKTADSDIDSRYLWSRLDLQHTPALSSATVFTYTGSKRDKNQVSPDDDEDSQGFLDYNQKTRKYSLRTDLSYRFGEQLMEFGWQAEYARSEYDATAIISHGDLGEIFGGEEQFAFDIHTDPKGWTGGAYWSGEFALSERWVLQPGIRWDFQDYDPVTSSDHISPRLGIKFSPSPAVTFRVDAGRFHQPQGIHELQVSDGVAQFFRPQRSDHFIAGIEWVGLPEWEVRAEVYEKQYRHPRRRFENLFNPFVMVPELEPDRVGFSPDKARAKGADLEIRRYIGERFTGVVRYSYMDAEDRIGASWVPRRWSQRHTVNAIASWEADNYVLAAAVTWHTGWRSSRPPPSLGEDETLAIPDVLNNFELPAYLSFDVSLSRTWQRGRSSITLFADVTNVINRDNLAGIDYDLDEDEDGTFLFTPDEETLMPIVPSIGVLIAF